MLAQYYFSDSNLPRDKFLQEAVKKNEGGWVPLTTLLTFKRLAALTTDAAVIAAALADSELVDVSEDKQSVRRSPNHPLPDEGEPQFVARMHVCLCSAMVDGSCGQCAQHLCQGLPCGQA